MARHRHRISIIGAGFAGLRAIRVLRETDPDCEITLIAPRAELHYLPSIIWIPSGLRTRKDLVIPLTAFFGRHRVQFHQGTVQTISSDGRTVLTDRGEVSNDGLIIASGGRFIKKLPGIEHALTPCEGITVAEQIRDRVAAMQGGTIALGFAGNPQEPTSVRGGPIFEFLFGLDEQLRREGRREQFKLVFFSPAKEPGNRLGGQAVAHLLADMARRGIDTHLGHKLVQFDARSVTTEGGQFAADLIVFMPGLTGNAWFDHTDLPRSPGGLLQADAQCRVVGKPLVYVAGDSGSYPGPDWMPKQAHMADLQAAAAAHNLLAELNGSSPNETFKTELFCIVDSLSKGTVIYRSERRNVMLPPTRLAHWAKRLFEHLYLLPYR